MKRRYLSVLLAIVALISAACACAADGSGGSVRRYEDPDTLKMALIWDSVDLLTDEEEDRLLEIMKPIAAYGHVVFSSDTNRAGKRTSDLAMYNLRKVCRPRQSGTIFEIDMANSMLYIYSDGAIYKVVTTSDAEAITDIVVGYAADGRWFECASEAFRQILSLLEGQGASTGCIGRDGGIA